MKQILFLEDHKSVRQGISASLEKLDSSIKIIQAGGIQEALDALSQNTQINAAIIDLSLATAQSHMGGVQMTGFLRFRNSAKSFQT